MRKLIVTEFCSLDGVVQAPGAQHEDPSGGFAHGGWHLQYFEDLSQKWVADGITSAGGFVLGRKTYEILGAYWPTAPEEEQVLAEPLNTLPKYVASRSLEEPLEWQNSTLLKGDAAEAVRALKEETGADLHVIGSPHFTQALIEHDLVDEVRLMIDPLVLGGGKRLFADDGVQRKLRLVDSHVTGTGVILATYAA